MIAQALSSVADNALLIAAIALIADLHGPDWMAPMMKWWFALAYVVLAAFVGAFADSFPKGRVMFITNAIKVCGCLLMFSYQSFGPSNVDQLLLVFCAYTLVGIGAAAYSPAKYGIVTEMLPPELLVKGNSWIEGLTVLSIILGTVLGGVLVNPTVSEQLLGLSWMPERVGTRAEAAILLIGFVYCLAALCNLLIPETGVSYPKQQTNPIQLFIAFNGYVKILWHDKLGQISLAVTTLFWGAGATLQFIVLKWAEQSLGMPLDKAAILQGIVACGVAVGAMAAARFVPLKKSLSVMPLGIVMGIVVMAMTMVHTTLIAYPLLVLVGALSGYFVVPMNALLQHRGHVLMSAGHSIAVQNFNENLSVLTMLLLYALMVKIDLDIDIVIVLFGLFVAGTMYLIMRRHAANQREHDSLSLIGETKH